MGDGGWTGWTGYAPIGGPPEGTACSFCGLGLEMVPDRGWMIGKEAAICPRCVARAARLLLGEDGPDAAPE